MKKIVRCNENDYSSLSEIWERSVRATHDFLTEKSIEEIRSALIPEYFPNVDLYAVDDSGSLAGFIGLSGEMIEMLLLMPIVGDLAMAPCCWILQRQTELHGLM